MKLTLSPALLGLFVAVVGNVTSTAAHASLTSCLQAMNQLSYAPRGAEVAVFTDQSRFILSSNIVGQAPLEYYLYSDRGICTYRLSENNVTDRYNTLPILSIQDPWDNSPLYLGLSHISEDGSGFGLIAQRQLPSVCRTFARAGRPCPYPEPHTVNCNRNDQRNARAVATTYIVDMLINLPEMVYMSTTQAILREFNLNEMPNQTAAILGLLSRSRTFATAVHFAKRTMRSSCGDLTDRAIVQSLAETMGRLNTENPQIRLGAQ